MNRNKICVFDYETSGKDSNTCQILQIGAVMMNARSLKVEDQFKTLVCPDDPKAIEDEALQINRLDLDELMKAPAPQVAWSSFVHWVQRFGTGWHAPVAAGYNIVGYDLPITARYCKRFGQWDEKWQNQKLFNPIFNLDVMQMMWQWTYHLNEPKNHKLHTIAEWLGVSEERLANLHDALEDVLVTADILRKLIQLMGALTMPQGKARPRLTMKGCFKEN